MAEQVTEVEEGWPSIESLGVGVWGVQLPRNCKQIRFIGVHNTKSFNYKHVKKNRVGLFLLETERSIRVFLMFLEEIPFGIMPII